jgi:hypothetical protein
MIDELNPKMITHKAVMDPIKLSKPKLVAIMLMIDPKVIMEQFPRQ